MDRGIFHLHKVDLGRARSRGKEHFFSACQIVMSFGFHICKTCYCCWEVCEEQGAVLEKRHYHHHRVSTLVKMRIRAADLTA